MITYARLSLYHLLLSDKASKMKQAVRAGTADPTTVIDDAISLLRSEAEMLRQQDPADAATTVAAGANGNSAAADGGLNTAASRSAAAAAKAVDAVLVGFERKAGRMKEAVAAGRVDAGAAVEEVFAGLMAATDDVLQAAAVADLDATLAEVTGG